VVAEHRDEQRDDEGSRARSADLDDLEPYATAEDFEDAELEGDRPFRAGTARAALSYSGFRRVFAGSIASNVGTWMQNVVLIAFATHVSGAGFAGLVGFAQLGPLLFVSLIGGSFADKYDRKMLLIVISIQQAIFTFLLAMVVRNPDPSEVLIVALVLIIGAGQAFAAPTFSSVLPSLVDKRDLAGAVSLTSANMNLSRMVGAVLGGFVYAQYGVAWVFVINAASYFFVIAGVATVDIPKPIPPGPGELSGLRRVLSGFTIARADPVLTKVLVTLVVFSFASLVFVVQMPTVAENFGIDPESTAYGWLYSSFAFGAFIGAMSVGSVFAGRDLGKLVRVGLLGFAVSLVVYALWRVPLPAYPTAFLVGFFYFITITSLSTILQTRLDNSNRGRVVALWIMGFGGVVPIGGLIGGVIIELSSITLVMLIGAAVALGLSFYARMDPSSPIVKPSS
jgi:MFS family permease